MSNAGLGVILVSLAFTAACSAQERNERGQDAPRASRSLTNDVPANTGGTIDVDPSTAPRRDSKGAPEGPHEAERGNTPPGKSRAGQGPASGAIVDPAGVTR